MNKNKLINKLAEQIALWNEQTGANAPLLRMETLLEEYLHKNPYDIDMLIKLALVEYTVPLADYQRAITYLNKVLEYDKQNLSALLLLVYIQKVYHGIDEKVLKKLQDFETDNNEEKALLYYAQALYFYERDDYKAYSALLKQSIDTYSGYVWPQFKLGQHKIGDGDTKNGCALVRDALKNVQEVSKPYDYLDFTDDQAFIKELIQGVSLSEPNYERICETVAACESGA